jgi:hypothetical protein
MRGCLLSHAISSVSSTPGVASGVTRRSGKPWFFANRFIESSLSPKSLAIIRNCSHRSVQVVIRTFHPSYVYIPSPQALLRSPQADPKRTRGGSCLVPRISLDSKNQLEILMVRLENVTVLACGAFYLVIETIECGYAGL